MMHSIRHLVPGDVVLFRKLNAMFAAAFDDADSYAGAIPSDRYLECLLDKPSVIALVALDKDDVVAGLVAYVLDKFERERSEIYIYDLAVAQSHRRRGIATALIRELARIARKIRAYVIYVQADRGDEPAVRLYESLGKREEVFHFDIDVSLIISARVGN